MEGVAGLLIQLTLASVLVTLSPQIQRRICVFYLVITLLYS